MKKNLNITSNIAKTILPDLPCEYAEIRLSSSLSTVIVISGDQIDTFTSGDSIGGSIRILNIERPSCSHCPTCELMVAMSRKMLFN